MSLLQREAECPSCGAPITFKFAGARSVVCKHCKTVVARSDGGLSMSGRMADLVDIPSPLQLDTSGRWNNEPFMVEGRVQMDRASAPGAPWQEFLVDFPQSGRQCWVAYAQGRWYQTSQVQTPGGWVPPPPDQIQPGSTIDLGPNGHWVVQEIGQRRVVSGEGSMPNVPKPGAVTWFVDISAQGGKFGTVDYGDGSEPATLFLGSQFDPRSMQLDSGLPVEMPQAEAKSVECPNCGGDLPILSSSAERVVCRYCGTASDVNQGNLNMLGPAPPPPIQPYIPLGSEAVLRGNKMIVCGFVIRSCVVEGVVYSWREYLLFGGEAVGYQWLMEEDGNWTHVQPIETGNVMDSGNSCMLNGAQYTFKQQVTATVDFVIGEFYWKVEIGETVEATEFQGPGGKVSREKSPREISYTFVTPLSPQELAAFGVAPPAMAQGNMGGATVTSSGNSGCTSVGVVIAVIVVVCIVLLMIMPSGGSSSSSGYRGGSSWSK